MITIGQMRCNAKPALATNTHPFDAILQPGNHAWLINAKRILLVLLDQLTAIQEQFVPDVDLRASSNSRAVPKLDVFIFPRRLDRAS